MTDPRAVVERLLAAQNAHDVDGMVACFHADYASEQPVFPARAFRGIEQVRANWTALLGAVRDFRGEALGMAVDGDTVFAELRWTGTKADGAPLHERGVVVFGVRDGRIGWGRLYMDEVHAEAPGIDAAVRQIAGTATPEPLGGAPPEA